MNTCTSITATGLALLFSLGTGPAALAADAAASDSKAQLEAIYQAEWERWLREDPTLGTSTGDARYNDPWPDLSMAAIQRSDSGDRAVRHKISHMAVAGLSAAGRMTYAI